MVADRDDRDDVYICHECIGDAVLKDEVRADGRKRTCHFCGKPRKAWPLDELAERVQSVIEEHFRTTPSDPRDEGFAYDKDMEWERRGDPIADVIANIAGLAPEPAEAIRERLSEQTSYDAFDGGYENPFGSETYYEEGRPDTSDFRESWAFFRQEIRTRSRFFGRHAQRALDEIFGDLASLKTWQGNRAVKELVPADEARVLYRARIAYSQAELREILCDPVGRLGPPPSRFARAGRMNAAGISVFYGALEPATCIAEVRPPVGSHVVLGCFKIIRPVRVLDLDVLTKVMTDGSWFHPEFTTRSNRAAFLRHLVDEISRPVMPLDEEFEYLPTQAVSEYLAECVEPRLDGIIFHSAQTAGEGRNVVLFHHAAAVEPYTIPEGTKIDIHMGWSSEDDYDDSIAVWEEVPSPQEPQAENGPAEGAIDFASILKNAPRGQEPEGERDDSVFSTEPRLSLDVQSIKVFRIDAVDYKSAERRVSRYRTPSDRHLDF